MVDISVICIPFSQIKGKTFVEGEVVKPLKHRKQRQALYLEENYPTAEIMLRTDALKEIQNSFLKLK